jgi:chemotaxis response regulator CheB
VSQKPTRVLAAGDSALIRDHISGMLSRGPDIEGVGAVPGPIAARERIKQLNPAVLTLDAGMPRTAGRPSVEVRCMLHGMPNAGNGIGAAETGVPLARMAQEILNLSVSGGKRTIGI